MNNWRECKLGDVADIVMGQSPKGNTCNTIQNGLPLLNGPTEYGIKHPKPVQYTVDPKRLAKKGDILFCVRGSTTGRMNWADQEYAIGRGIAAIRHKQDKNVNSFIKGLIDYYLPSLLSGAAGSVFPNITGSQLSEVPIILPSLPEQSAIAGVLSNLDDKIDLLHRQNKTLEAMAETLFRQWFVEAVDEGWEEKPLSSIANFLNGLACQKYPPKNNFEKLPILKIKELGSGISDSSDWATTHVSPEYIVQAGDVIFAWSASLMVKVWDGEKCVLNQHLFKVTSDQYPKWFYLAWCKHHLAEFISISLSHATTMGHIKRGDLDAAIVLVPSDTKLSAISKQMTPLLDRQIVNAKQIRTLQKLRDTLLPKLMSGELRVDV